MNKTDQTEQEEIGRIKLSDTQDLVASLVGGEKLDLRVFVKSDSYTGATKRGFRFYLPGNNWIEFKKLIDDIDVLMKRRDKLNEKGESNERRVNRMAKETPWVLKRRNS